ncbi:response regulator [Cohnella sp. GbtcB17]|uniref:response regulator n=1 Tax=Cohnella sp. GbtcB17 TaxID=2824762 RepID=UPI001C3021B0|nr:response regulator [Cohnella sp. GbtcB17]
MSRYQTMIVEDNAVYRHAIRTLIDWERSGFRIAAEAVNGKQALEKMAEQRFDLILTDVSMPEMNGIDLVKAVNERGEDTVIVMLSAYDDFQFVKDSLKLGADDYLLKQEMEPDTMVAMLGQVKEKLSRLRSSRKKERSNRSEAQAARLKQWMTGEANAHPAADDGLAELLPAGDYRLILLASRECGEMDGDRIQQAAQDGATELECGRTLAIPIRSGRLALVAGVPDDGARGCGSGRAARELAGRWLGQGEDRCSRAAAIAAGRGSAGLYGLREAYEEAERALFLAVYEGWGRLFEAEPKPPAPANQAAEAEEAARRWQAAVRSGSGEDMAAAAACQFDLLSRAKPAKVVLQRQLVDLYASLYHHADPAAHAVPDWWSVLSGSIDRLDPIRRMEADFAAFCRERFPESEAVPANRKEIRQAIAYIRSHYAEDISVAGLSGQLGFSANYLSNLFRSETGLRVTEYVNRVRMEVAKRLLRDMQLKVYEVASKVGYHDASYFCKVFKEVTGETVTAFRQKE